jgi:archaeal type IV pilus assembly protein PilA
MCLLLPDLKFLQRDEAMNVQKNAKRGVNTDAVSPVIGVMLMIVVTIIIAAVVSAFAGGFAESQKKTPSAQIDVQLKEDQDSSGTWYAKLVFAHKGGDPLATRDLRIVIWNQTGTRIVTDGSTDNDGYPCKIENGLCDDEQNKFGNTTWSNGDILATNSADSTEDLLGSGSPLYKGKTIAVDIVYTPTNELIFHKDVMAS